MGVAVLGVLTAADERGGEILSEGGGVILTLGEVKERFPLSTELLLPPRLQEETESDFEGVVLLKLILLEAGLPSEVPPLMTVVEFGVNGGASSSPSSGENLELGPETERLPNLPPKAAVMGSWSGLETPNWDRRWSAWLARRIWALRVADRKSKDVDRGPAVAGG